VNVAAFKSQGMADAFAEVLRKRGLDPFVWSTDLKKGPGKMYRVSIGRFATKRQAELYAKELKEKHGFDTYVVKKPGT
jgi:cell division septation protein DedD